MTKVLLSFNHHSKKHLLSLIKKIVVFSHNHWGVTPNGLSYFRIFASPWLALLFSFVISTQSVTAGIIVLVLYWLVAVTDVLDGALARALPKEKQDHANGGMLDRLGDKILVIFLLIPFGLRPILALIVFGESILAYQAIAAPAEKKQAKTVGKIKMLGEVMLISLLLLGEIFPKYVPVALVLIISISVVILVFSSIWSHYKA